MLLQLQISRSFSRGHRSWTPVVYALDRSVTFVAHYHNLLEILQSPYLRILSLF